MKEDALTASVTSEDSEISLVKLVEEIDEHTSRIRARAQSPNASGIVAATPMMELSGTVLPILRDLVSYVSALEAAVARGNDVTEDRLAQIEDGLLSVTQTDGGTQFEPEDAEKFMEFLKASKIILESLHRESANPEPVKQKIGEMIGMADELIGIVEDCTIEDEEDDAEAATISASQAGGTV